MNSKNIRYLLAFLVPVLVYLQTITFDFTYFDDNKIIIKNQEFLSHFENIKEAFKTDAFLRENGIFYRPVQTVSFMVDIFISGGNNPWMYHLSNVILLGIFSILLFKLLQRLKIETKLAMLSTLLFCVHPLFVSNAAWIPARGDLLLALFSVFSFSKLVDYVADNKIKTLIIHWISFTIALFSKETAAFLPFLFLLYIICYHKFNRNNYKLVGLYALTGIIWFLIRYNALHGHINDSASLISTALDDKTGLFVFFANLKILPESVSLFFLPGTHVPIPGFTIYRMLTGLGLMVFIVYLFVKNKTSNVKTKIFWLSWFLILLVPTLFFKHDTIDFLPHRFLLPHIGLLVFVLLIIPATWYKKGEFKYIGVARALLFIFILLSFWGTKAYKDGFTFYNAAVEQNPKSVFAYNNRGAAFHKQGNLEAAIQDYNKAIELKPDYAIAFISRGNAWLVLKNDKQAIVDYTRAIELQVFDGNLYNNRGVAHIHLGEIEKACADFEQAVNLGSNGASANMERFCINN